MRLANITRSATWRYGLSVGSVALATLIFTQLPRHNSDHAPLARHATVYTVKVNGGEAEVVSALQVFRTALDGGATELYTVARLIDTVKLDADGPKLARRHVRMETRQLGFGTHVPL